MYENENNKENKTVNKERRAILVSIVSLLAICFCASYFITDYITNPDRQNDNENKTVYSDTDKYLSDKTYITLQTGEDIDSGEELSSYRERLGIAESLTKVELIEMLKDEGYEISKQGTNELVFKREKVISSKFQADKYYLGESDNHVVLFKTDSNGKVVEAEKKIYSEMKPISGLPEIDQISIKEYKFFYNTKDEALEKLSEMLS